MFGATRSTLWDRDEPRNAYAAVEMANTGNWLYPTVKGEVRAKKPILAYWMMIPCVKTLGQTELAVRLPAIFGTLLAMLMTFLTARKLLPESPRTALVATAMLPACPLVIATGATATTDGLLLGGVTTAFYALTLIFFNNEKHENNTQKNIFSSLSSFSLLKFCLLLLAGLTFAQYAKGPVGIAIPFLAVAIFLVMIRRERPVRYGIFIPVFIFIGLLSIAFFLAWLIPADRATNGKFLQIGLKNEIVQRTTTVMESHGGKSWKALLYVFYYPVVLLLTFFPFTLFLPAAIKAWWKEKIFPRRAAWFLGAWTIAPIAIFTCIATKLPHYILPCFPALCIVVAAYVCGKGGARSPSAPAVSAKPPHLATVKMICVIAGVYLIWSAVLAPVAERYKITPGICRLVRESVTPDVKIGMCGYEEPSVYFYLPAETPVVTVERSPEAIREFLESPECPGLIIREKEMSEFRDAFPDISIREYGKISGFNYTKGKFAEIHFIRL
ncbi:MAG: glycosyltransferase family 39 protein [Kiritimatiellaeota bacterium]|nr:glycosyltransferase family 39 protein [Kiritimatiellota bacterium]